MHQPRKAPKKAGKNRSNGMHRLVFVSAFPTTALLFGCGEPQPPIGMSDGVTRAHLVGNIYQYGWCAYDQKGNLYVDGSSDPPDDNQEFAELPSGKRKLTTVTLNGDLKGYDWLQWDGKYITLSSATAELYQYAIKGT
jgi:hypothetical protein